MRRSAGVAGDGRVLTRRRLLRDDLAVHRDAEVIVVPSGALPSNTGFIWPTSVKDLIQVSST